MNNNFRKILLATLFLLTASLSHAAETVKWGYEGNEGPLFWADLSPDFSLCRSTDQSTQSPVDISTYAKSDLGKIRFDYKKEIVRVINNGHTLEFITSDKSSITVAGKKYTLVQFHFHTPTEHTIKGKPLDMVIHLVHKAADGQLAVIAVLMKKRKKGNKLLDRLFAYFPGTVDEEVVIASAKYNPEKLLPEETEKYYNYSGSLTTPPCSEGVNWLVMAKSSKVSMAVYDKFHSTFHNNVRPVQPLNGREIILNKD